MSYGELYRLEYRDQLIEGQDGRLTTIKILERDYTGDWSYVKGSGNPVRISGKTDDDYLFSQIICTSIDIELISEESFQFISLFSSDAKKHKVEMWKEPVPGETQILWGTWWVLPDNYIEPLHFFENYTVKITATDGLANLKDYALLNRDGLHYEGKWTLAEAIKEICVKTGLELPFEYALSFRETNVSMPTDTSIFHNIYIDWEAFYIKDSSVKCDYVLKQILQAFGARIYQSKGSWIILQATKNGQAHTRVKSDFSSYTKSPVRMYTGQDDLTNDRLFFVNREGDLQIDPAYKSLTVHHDYLKRKSILINSDFTNARVYKIMPGLKNPSVPSYYPFNWTNNGEGHGEMWSVPYTGVLNSFEVWAWRDSINYIKSDWVSIEGFYYKVSLSVDYCSLWGGGYDDTMGVQVQFLKGSTLYYLHSDKTWSTTPAYLTVPGDNSVEFGQEPWFNYTILSNQVPGAGKLRVLLCEIMYVKNISVELYTINPNLVSIYKDVSFNVSVNEDNNLIPSTIESILGDVPNILDREDIYAGTFWRYDGTNYIPTISWASENQTENITILQCLADLISDNYRNPKWYLTGLRLRGNFDIDSSLQVGFLGDRVFVPIHWDFDDKYCECVIDCFELPGDRVLATEALDFIMTEDNDYIQV